jgi:hypothetical protein
MYLFDTIDKTMRLKYLSAPEERISAAVGRRPEGLLASVTASVEKSRTEPAAE